LTVIGRIMVVQKLKIVKVTPYVNVIIPLTLPYWCKWQTYRYITFTDLQVSYIYRPTGILHLQTYGYLTFRDLQVSYIYRPTGILHLQTYRYLTFTDLQVSYIYRPTGILYLQTYGYLTFTDLQVSYIYSDTVILHFILSILSWLHGDKSPHTNNIS
jgi:hypothetical protein